MKSRILLLLLVLAGVVAWAIWQPQIPAEPIFWDQKP